MFDNCIIRLETAGSTQYLEVGHPSSAATYTVGASRGQVCYNLCNEWSILRNCCGFLQPYVFLEEVKSNLLLQAQPFVEASCKLPGT